MTNFSLSKKQIISLLVLLALVLILPLALFLSRQRQEVRKKAAGTGALELSLSPDSSTEKQRGDLIAYTVKLANKTADPFQIRVVGVEFAVSPSLNDLDVSNFNCGTALNGKAFGDTATGLIRLVCYKPGGPSPNLPLEIPGNTTIDVGSFQVTLKDTATGSYTISSKVEAGGRNNIPLATEPYTDLSNIPGTGAEATITVAGAPITGTPTPTATLTLTPTPTTGAVASPTPTTPAGASPTPTTPAESCLDGDKGNLNCDAQGLINEIDFAILIAKWHTSNTTPIPTPNPGHRSADIAGNDGLVNELDFAKLIANWKTQ